MSKIWGNGNGRPRSVKEAPEDIDLPEAVLEKLQKEYKPPVNPRELPVDWNDPMSVVPRQSVSPVKPVVEVEKRGRGRPRKLAWECPRCHTMNSPYATVCGGCK